MIEIAEVVEVAAASEEAAEVVEVGAAVSEIAASEAVPVNEDDAAEASAAGDEREGVVALHSRPVVGGGFVQHVGTWLLMSLAQRDGLHDEFAKLGGEASDQIASDATLASLAIGERTVEGVRRLATPTAPQLLRADHAPTASAVRRRLWGVAEPHGATLMAQMGRRYLDAARGDADTPAVFYIDNHMRPYCGDQIVRKGWRMQEHRALPGTSDYYVHDEDGRPRFRVDVPSHDSLSRWLIPIATRLREALGPDERILLPFDRAGSHADDMASLRDAGFEFVAYERKPFALLAATAFDPSIQIRGVRYGLHEHRMKHLGRERGRVRRISLPTPEATQINVLGISSLPAAALVGILLGRADKADPSGRWVQENGFKHGVERWGMNQLDGRKVEPVPVHRQGLQRVHPAHRHDARPDRPVLPAVGRQAGALPQDHQERCYPAWPARLARRGPYPRGRLRSGDKLWVVLQPKIRAGGEGEQRLATHPDVGPAQLLVLRVEEVQALLLCLLMNGIDRGDAL